METDFIYMNVYGSTLRKIIEDLEGQIEDYKNYEGESDNKKHAKELESELNKAKKIYNEYYI